MSSAAKKKCQVQQVPNKYEVNIDGKKNYAYIRQSSSMTIAHKTSVSDELGPLSNIYPSL